MYFALILISSKYCVTDRAVYCFLIISILSVILTFFIIILIKQFNNNLTASVIMMAFFVMLWALGWLVEVLIRCTLAKMVPSTCQTFTEAIRNGVSGLSMILAAITMPLSLPYLEQWCAGLIIINVVLLVAFLVRTRSLLLIRKVEFPQR